MRPHTKPISPETMTFINEMDGLIAGLKAGSPSVVGQSQNRINMIYEELFKRNKFPIIVEKNIDYFYNDFLPQIIPLLLKILSPGSCALLSINIVQFVYYKISKNDPSHIKLLNLFFEDEVLLNCFKNITSSESTQYNRTISGSTTNYVSSPSSCQYVLNPPQTGVDFISITVQNCGRRLLFHSFLDNLTNLKSFESFKEIAKFFEYCAYTLHPNFRQFLFNHFETNLFKKMKNDDRFNSPYSLYIHRIAYLIVLDNRMRQSLYNQYFSAITKCFLNEYTEQPFYEVKIIMSTQRPDSKIITFISSFLDILFNHYKNDYNFLIKDILFYLKSQNNFPAKSSICNSLIGKWDLLEALMELFENDLDYTLVYENLKETEELTHSMVNILLSTISKLSKTNYILDITKEIIRSIIFADKSSLPSLINLIDDNRNNLISAINSIIDKNEITKKETASLICKLVQETDLQIDLIQFSNSIVSLLKGKELLEFFMTFEFLSISDLPLFVNRVGKISQLLNFLHEKFLPDIYLVEHELILFNPSELLIKLFVNSFILVNDLHNFTIPKEPLAHLSLLFNALIISSRKFISSYREIKPKVQKIIDSQPNTFLEFILYELNSDNFDKSAFILQSLDFSSFISKIGNFPITELNDKLLYFLFILKYNKNPQKDDKEDYYKHAALIDLENTKCEDEKILMIYKILQNEEKSNQEFFDNYQNAHKLIKATVLTILLESNQGITYDSQKLFDLAIDSQFLSLMKHLSENIKINTRNLTNLPLFFHHDLYNLLMTQKDDILCLSSALKFAEPIEIPYVLKIICEKSNPEINKISTQIIAEIQRVDDPYIFNEILKSIPKCLNKFLLLTFFFSPVICPLLRTSEVIKTFFSLFADDTFQLLKFFQTNKCASISFSRCGLMETSNNGHGNSILQVLSSFLPIYLTYHTEDNKLLRILKDLEFSDNPFIEDHEKTSEFFKEDHDASDSWEYMMNFLTKEQKALFEFQIDNKVQHTVNLPHDTQSISIYLRTVTFDTISTVVCFKYTHPTIIIKPECQF
ncbi:hypothetical protein TRFO_21725 [Tritrichomonas foetus]|uniref:Uncharacterized protein n=1 Tax=Tritrichomonas foetus TaxID=1144522 RepID=A0A1J4KEH3_9EUKA|nr:hypothetical protein TRFO_21725 [Tritrichomonas foetus]|eukprot:OHT09336.1 hypothetical protein TRFO_21725 [Tritrichomonas foetus]